MSIDKCSKVFNPQQVPFSTGGAIYDGSATCTGFTQGTLNDLIIHITDLICQVNDTISDLNLDITQITVPSTFNMQCIGGTPPANLSSLLTSMLTTICEIQTALSQLNATQVGFAVNVDFSCIGMGVHTNVESALHALAEYLCNILQIITPYPLVPFDPYIVTDPILVERRSMGGKAYIEISPEVYWINQRFVSKAQALIELPDNRDNYLYINKHNDLYEVVSVEIGSRQPTTNGDIILYAQTGEGEVLTIDWETYIKTAPVSSDLIRENAILEGHISDNSVTESKIKDGSVTETKIGINSIDTTHYKDHSITIEKINPFVYNIFDSLNGAEKNVEEINGVIDCTGNFNTFHILTQSNNIIQININQDDNKFVIISNNTGHDIHFVIGGNIILPKEILRMRAEKYVFALFKNQEVRFIDDILEHNNALHEFNLVGEAGVISSMVEKQNPVGEDLVVIEDSQDDFTPKKIPISKLGGEIGIHDNTNHRIKLVGEDGVINAMQEKPTPVGTDLLVIEDSENLFETKKVSYSTIRYHNHNLLDLAEKNYHSLDNIPTEFNPSAHNHNLIDLQEKNYQSLDNIPTEFNPSVHDNTSHSPHYKIATNIFEIATTPVLTPTGDFQENEFYVKQLAEGLIINAPSGTPATGNTLVVFICDNGTSRTLTWNVAYYGFSEALPTATIAGKGIFLGFVFLNNKWNLVSVTKEI